MSDNSVKVDIGDVLSSVKRLVNEDGTRDMGQTMAVNETRKPGRLVLTEALRVSAPEKPARSSAPLKLGSEYSAEVSARPMILRTSDIIRAGGVVEEKPKQPEPAKKDEALAGSLSSKIEALEAAIARTEDQWEPDGDSDDAYSGTPSKSIEWNTVSGFVKPATKETAQPNLPAEPEQKAASVEEEAVSDPIQGIDRDELRALVAQMVRDELQGALGERITRNLRKMVRREIQKALAERDTA